MFGSINNQNRPAPADSVKCQLFANFKMLPKDIGEIMGFSREYILWTYNFAHEERQVRFILESIKNTDFRDRGYEIVRCTCDPFAYKQMKKSEDGISISVKKAFDKLYEEYYEDRDEPN